MSTAEEIKAEVLDAAKTMYARGLVEGTAGNVSGRVDTDVVAMTPSSLSYEAMTLEDIVLCDLDGKVLEGERSPTSEKGLHLSCYSLYPEVQGVVHCHAKAASMFAVAHQPIPAGIDEGHQIRLTNEGEVGPRGGMPGSLYVAVHVAPHPALQREGTELYFEADLSIARGLDYYTGTVFETRMRGFERLGSICSGGRYDSLASDARTTYPGVGISLGVSRLLVPLFQRGLLTASRAVPSAVLVALPDEESRSWCDAVAQQLRTRGIAAEAAASPLRFGKQIRYAERRGIPFVWFGTESGHEVKDIRSGEQVAADPAAWSPPEQDLRPQLIVTEELS